jgi:hypothetical protein
LVDALRLSVEAVIASHQPTLAVFAVRDTDGWATTQFVPAFFAVDLPDVMLAFPALVCLGSGG